MEERFSDLEGDPSLVLESVLVDRFPVERVPVERFASCHPIHEHRKDSACHLGVDPSQTLG